MLAHTQPTKKFQNQTPSGLKDMIKSLKQLDFFGLQTNLHMGWP